MVLTDSGRHSSGVEQIPRKEPGTPHKEARGRGGGGGGATRGARRVLGEAPAAGYNPPRPSARPPRGI
ncbi:hypothetical protein, partial [Nocardia asiatica]|uniref:hypothetical protein n=1 Tax=Nocardia asiatica TaxID=209252 RepID=UPI002455991B